MPRGSPFGSCLGALAVVHVLVASTPLFGCREDGPREQSAASATSPGPRAVPGRARRAAPAGDFSCRELRPPPMTEDGLVAETIELSPPRAEHTLVIEKTGVVVTFDRRAFLEAARCLKLEQAIRYVEAETGRAAESHLIDAFQLSYVAAALLDAGRAGVRPADEKLPRESIVRDGWAADGCNGTCRSLGRLYRLSEDDASFFLRLSDKTW